MKYVVCDTSSLISLTESCLFNIIEFLNKMYGVKFIISEGVKYEGVDHPLNIKNEIYSFSARKINNGIKKEMIDVVKLSKRQKELVEEIIEYGNNMFFMKGKPLRLIHRGEVEMLVLAISNDIGHVLMDERTTRMMVEAPYALKKHLEEEFRINVMVNKKNLDAFQELVEDIKVVRSSELVLFAYTHGFFDDMPERDKFLKSALYKIKYSGCAITREEIERMVAYVCNHK